MKTLVLAAVAALATAPVFAQNLTAAEFAAAHFAKDHETGDGPRTVPTLSGNGEILSTSNQDVAAFAAAHLENGPEDRR